MSDKSIHPCVQCGACCASFRVSFHAKEVELLGNLWQVPSSMIEKSGEVYTMKGTDEKHRPACKALDGTIGKKVGCNIYSNRPSPCRNFLASYEDGIHRPRCDEARRKHGLRPLGREAYGEKPAVARSSRIIALKA